MTLGGLALALVLVVFMLLKREDLRNRLIRLIGAGLTFFAGLILARIVGHVVEAALGALNIVGGNRMLKSFYLQAIVFVPLAGPYV